MARTRTVFVYNTAYVNGEQVRIGRMVVGVRIALGLMFSGISFLAMGIIMTLMEDDDDSSIYIGGIVNMVFGGLLIGSSLITLAVVHCQQRRQRETGQSNVYNPPLPGTYPTQQLSYPSQQVIYPSQTIAYPQTLHVQESTYPLPCTTDQVDAYPAASFPGQYTQFAYQAPGVSAAASNTMSQNHQKSTEAGGPTFPTENPPPYFP